VNEGGRIKEEIEVARRGASERGRGGREWSKGEAKSILVRGPSRTPAWPSPKKGSPLLFHTGRSAEHDCKFFKKDLCQEKGTLMGFVFLWDFLKKILLPRGRGNERKE